MTATFTPSSLDHVALWVDDREPLAAFLCDHLGMHVIEATDTFTLVGVDAKLGKLTLFDAEGPRQRGALERVVLRVGELERVLTTLPFDTMRQGDGVAAFEAPAGVPLGLVEADGADFDLDHVVLGLSDPEAAARELATHGLRTPRGRLRRGRRPLREDRARQRRRRRSAAAEPPRAAGGRRAGRPAARPRARGSRSTR